MAQDRPTASELLAAIADLLREEVTPVLDKVDPRLGFQMRVAANSLAILERASAAGPSRASRWVSGGRSARSTAWMRARISPSWPAIIVRAFA